jgi:5'-phosphate synthase pdxT subunit
MKIAILALQGAFAEHEQMLRQLGCDTFLIRCLDDWNQPKDGLVIPGGESTAMMRILQDEGLIEPIRQAILQGLPVFGTCAGMILLDDAHLHTMDISVCRNAYGRQLGSFYTEDHFEGVDQMIPMTFIRAPYITRVGQGCKVLSVVDGNMVAAQQENQLVTSFHPELNQDTRVHSYFLEMIRKSQFAM